MRIAHVMPNHKVFTRLLITFFSDFFGAYDFHFVILDKEGGTVSDGSEYAGEEKVKYVPVRSCAQESDALRALFSEYDLCVFHSMMLYPRVQASLFLRKPEWIGKIAWVAWGYDLYLKKPKNLVGVGKCLIKRGLRLTFSRKIPYFVAIHPSDIDVYRKIVRGNALVQCAPYLLKEKVDHLDGRMYTPVDTAEKIKRGEPVSIMIGHRAAKALNHGKWLKALSRFRDENIRIVLPLSYGDAKYGDEVEALAKEIFGDKAMVLRQVIPIDDYFKLIGDIDIFMLDSNRQIALGNVYSFFRHQAKIFIPTDSSIYRYYAPQGIPLCDLRALEKCTFGDMTAAVDMRGAAEAMRAFDLRDNVREWRDVIDRMIADKESKGKAG